MAPIRCSSAEKGGHYKMSRRIVMETHRLGEFRPSGPARSACGGQAPTSSPMAHSRSSAGPSDPDLDPDAVGENGR